MKWPTLVGALCLAACDPGVEVQFVVSPADDATAQHGTGIAHVLAQRHGMRMRPVGSSCNLAAHEATFSSTHWLYLCLDQQRQNITFTLTEWIATAWGQKGDSLQRELDDTLRAHFGDRVERIE